MLIKYMQEVPMEASKELNLVLWINKVLQATVEELS